MPPPRKEFLSKIRGTWADENGNVYYVREHNADVVVGFTQWNPEKEEFATRNKRMSIRMVGDRPLLFLPADEGVDDRFLFMWLSHVDGESINARQPNPKVFHDAIDSGQLRGEIVKRDSGHFDARLKMDDDLTKRLAGPDGSTYFEKQHDRPLRRAGTPTAR